MTIETQEVREHYRAPEGCFLGAVHVSACGQSVAFCVLRDFPRFTTNADWRGGALRSTKQPLSEIFYSGHWGMVVHLLPETDQAHVVYGGPIVGGHAQISPVDRHLFMFFSYAAPWGQQRAWLVRVGGHAPWPSYEPWPAYPQGPREHCTHTPHAPRPTP